MKLHFYKDWTRKFANSEYETPYWIGWDFTAEYIKECAIKKIKQQPWY